MATRKKETKSLPELLAKELRGEPAPEVERIALALRASLGVAIIEPWSSLYDSHVFAFDSERGQRWYCIVMGSLGEMLALQAYRGDHGFALWEAIQRRRIQSSDFLARQDVFTIEFVPRAELSALDRAVLPLLPAPIPAGQRVPQFTVSRPRQLPWFPNAGEMEEINDGLMASLLFFEWLATHPGIDPWKKPRQLPLLADWATGLRVEQIPFPKVTLVGEIPPKLDERVINPVLMTMASRKAGPALETDAFLFRAPVGDETRPYFPWAALACDAVSGFMFAPVLCDLTKTRADALVQCVLDALRQAPFRPAALHVGDKPSQAALMPLAAILELPVKVTKIKSVSQARMALEGRLG